MKKTILLLLSAVLTMPIFAQNNFEKHNFSMNLGYAYKTTDQHPLEFANMIDNQDHASAMKHGYELEFDYDYRFHRFLSFGFKASLFGSVHGFDVTTIDGSGKEVTSYYTDDMNIFYVGPSFKVQLPTIANHWDIWARATAGYMNMRNTDKNITSATYSGSCFGYGFGFGADYSISKYMAVGFSTSMLGGTVSTLKIGEDEIDITGYEEALHRFNFNIGVRIRL
jgi:hypothetical protein